MRDDSPLSERGWSDPGILEPMLPTPWPHSLEPAPILELFLAEPPKPNSRSTRKRAKPKGRKKTKRAGNKRTSAKKVAGKKRVAKKKPARRRR